MICMSLKMEISFKMKNENQNTLATGKIRVFSVLCIYALSPFPTIVFAESAPPSPSHKLPHALGKIRVLLSFLRIYAEGIPPPPR